MKTLKKLIILVAVVALGVFCITNKAQDTKTVTTIGIITDYKMANTPDNDSILCDFVKVIKAECDHIFINPALWFAFLDNLEQQKVSFDPTRWEFYDTNLGLIYLRNSTKPHHEGIQYHQFKPIAKPLELETVVSRNWTGDLDKIFNVTVWQEQYSKEKHKCMVYMSGHGAHRADKVGYKSVGCGMISNDFMNVALFFNQELPIDTLVINSCFWTADRLREELQQAGAAELTYTVISPLQTEQMLWLTADLGCECERCTRDCPSFFDTCRTFTGLHEAEITPELSAILCSSDTVMDNIEKMQAPTVIMAGSHEPVSIMA
jgi:hypothetical protein